MNIKNKRISIVKVRVTKQEHTQWHAKADATGLSLSELIRRSMSRVNTWTAANADVEIARNRSLAKIGNNINQIARWANTYKQSAEAIEIIVSLQVLEQQLLLYRPTSYRYKGN